MRVRLIDPLQDRRWPAFLERQPHATVFHTPAWLDALRRAYGYEPVAITTAVPGHDLRNGLVFCRVKSPWTGRRAVSLPFADHCEPLVGSTEELECFVSALKREVVTSGAAYLELRPLTGLGELSADLGTANTFWFHQLELRLPLDELLGRCHKNCIQRKIRASERYALQYHEGRSESLLTGFYRLLVLTRRRQQLPPQPLAWFRALIDCLGENLKLRLALIGNRPVAAILTLRYKDTLTYKYGCSDKSFANLGGMQMLFWKAIQEAKQEGLAHFDLGRSDWDNQGLIDFKDRWGAARSRLTYWRYPASAVSSGSDTWRRRIAGHIFAHLPMAVLPYAGKLLYRHVG